MQVEATVHSRNEMATHPNEKLVYLQIKPDNVISIRMPAADADQLPLGAKVTITIEETPPAGASR